MRCKRHDRRTYSGEDDDVESCLNFVSGKYASLVFGSHYRGQCTRLVTRKTWVRHGATSLRSLAGSALAVRSVVALRLKQTSFAAAAFFENATADRGRVSAENSASPKQGAIGLRSARNDRKWSGCHGLFLVLGLIAAVSRARLRQRRMQITQGHSTHEKHAFLPRFR